MNRGQLAFEFTIVVMLLLTITAGFSVLARDKLMTNRQHEDQKGLTFITDYVQNEVAIARGTRDGYYREFQLPASVNGREYNVSIQGAFVKAQMGELENLASVGNVTGTLTVGKNVVKNVNGVVILN